MSKLARFARTQGARDKKKRRSRMLRNIAIGLGGTALLGGAAYLGRGKIAGLMGKGKPPAATSGGSPRPTAPNPPSSGGGSPPPPTPKSPSPSGGGSPQPKTNPVENGRQSQPPAPKPKKKLSSKEKLELRRKAIIDHEKRNSSLDNYEDIDDYLSLTSNGRPLYGDYFTDLKQHNDSIRFWNSKGKGSIDVAHANKKKRQIADHVKIISQRLKDRGLYYSSGLPITAFSQHKPTMMSLASFNRKYSQGKNRD